MSENTCRKDTYIASRIEARSTSAVIKIRFLNFRSRFPKGPILAVEGNDDKIVYSYWLSRIILDINYEFFVCKNKNELRMLRNSLSRDRYESDLDTAFLVDRDFDDLDRFECKDNVFMLDRYSIENYLVDKSVVKKTISVAFPGNVDPRAKNNICVIFEEDYNCFLDIVSDTNRQLFFSRRLRVDVDNCMPDSLAKLAIVQLGDVKPCDPPAELALKNALSPLHKTTSPYETEFSQLDPVKRYRGKFSYKFLRGWLDRLADEYRNNRLGLFSHSEEASGKVKYDEMSLGALSCRSSIPIGFEEFFIHFFRMADNIDFT